MSHPRLAQRLYNSALLITPGKAEVIEQVFRAHQEGRAALLAPPAVEAPRKELDAPGITKADAGYYRTASGIALITAVGTLVQRGDSMDAASGLVGYNTIAAQLQAAVDDPRVGAILLEIDSNGGEAAGLFDLAGKVRAANQRKPTWAAVNEQAFSAAYGLAAAAGRVAVPQSGMVGSVGVVMMHVDQSVKDAKAGITYTPIYAGARKVDFSQHAPLTDAAMQIAQDEVDRVYEMFVNAVADSRGMDPQAVRDTEAGLFDAQTALDRGLIDAVESFDATLMALAIEAQRFRVDGPRAVTNPKGARAMNATADQIAAAKAEGVNEGKAAADAELAKKVAEASVAAQARVAAILTHAEAAGRATLAQHLAFKTTQSVDDAVALLAASPKEVAAAPGNAFAAHMDKVGNAKVVPDAASANAAANGDAAQKVPKTATQIYEFRRQQVVKARQG